MRRAGLTATALVSLLVLTAASFPYVQTPRILMGQWQLRSDSDLFVLQQNGTTVWDCLDSACTFANLIASQNWRYLTPPQLVANADNYAPTGCSLASIFRLSSDAARDLTGISAATCASADAANASKIVTLENVGAFPITLKHNATSNAENRFSIGADYALAAGTAVTVAYDTPDLRWKLIHPLGGTGAGVTDGDKGDVVVSGVGTVWDIDEAAVEGKLDLQDLQGAVTDLQVPNNITIDLATAAGSAAALSCTNCVGATEIDGSSLHAEVNPTLGTETQGNFVATVATTAPLSGGNAGTEGTAISLTTSMSTAKLIGRTTALAGPMEEIGVSAPLTLSALNLALGDVALTTNTSGNYVKDVADGTGIDGTAAGEGATYTPSLDLTEITCSAPMSCPAATTITTSMATNKLIGRGTASTGVMEEITLGSGLSLSGTTLTSTAVAPLTVLGADVPCATSAAYCTIFTVPAASIAASRGLILNGVISVVSGSTTVASQFRVRSDDTGYTGNCMWESLESTTLTTAPGIDNTPIAAAPVDTAGTTWSVVTAVPERFTCALISDGSPGDIIIEWELETGTSPSQTVKRGSYYMLVQ